MREDDHFVVNGQKTWTTLAHFADMIFCLVRTDPTAKKQEGITFLLIDMNSPGITVRPLVTHRRASTRSTRSSSTTSRCRSRTWSAKKEKGWTYAKYLLGHERTGITGVGASKRELTLLKEIAAKQSKGGKPHRRGPDLPREDRPARDRPDGARDDAPPRALEAGDKPGPEASILKIKGTEVQQGLTELMMEALGPYAEPFSPHAIEDGGKATAIGAGLRRADRRAATSTGARPRSTAAPTRSSTTSSRKMVLGL